MSLELKKINGYESRRPVLLVILDGVGIGKEDDTNGVYLAKTPCLDSLMNSEMYTQLKAHGTAVGMPSDEDMGNSEVGHNALGAGRVFDQGATLVQNAVVSGKIFESETWRELSENVKTNNSTFHFISLLSDGNVHSNINHLLAVLKQCSKEGIDRVRIHGLLDGRDVYERSALDYIAKVEEVISELGKDYKIASGGGRMLVTMDRYDADWPMVERGWKAHVLGEADQFSSAKEAVEKAYEDESVKDQYIPPFVIAENGKPIGVMQDGDSVALLNFRGDRAQEICKAFDQGDEFDKFDRKRKPNVKFAGIMQYDADLQIPKKFLVDPPQIDRPAAEYMCALGLKTFGISETQKYGHVTYFWNGNKSGFFNEGLETFVEIPSDNIPFDQKPKMKAYEITDQTIEFLKSGEYQFGRINFPNGDMVGHTGNMAAVIETMEATDECLQKILDVQKELGGITVVLADHGNADEMLIEKNGKRQVSTAHSLNPVPCAIVDPNYGGEYQMSGIEKPGLANVAATLLNLLGYEKPEDYEASLIKFKR